MWQGQLTCPVIPVISMFYQQNVVTVHDVRGTEGGSAPPAKSTRKHLHEGQTMVHSQSLKRWVGERGGGVAADITNLIFPIV